MRALTQRFSSVRADIRLFPQGKNPRYCSIKRQNSILKAISESMMEIYEASALEEKDIESILCRPRIDFTSILDLVSLCL